MPEAETLEFTGRRTPEGRPIFKNQSGDFVTERTITEHVPELGGFVNIPTVHDGEFLTPNEAIDRAIESSGKDLITGRKLDVFDNVKDAVKSARKRSGSLGKQINRMLAPQRNATFK